ncbi:MAG: hypothetical protein L0I29_17000 [Hyphomicrobiales bacterium]|nr:hypothetical protein [Hyphomicrobiales bacterium]
MDRQAHSETREVIVAKAIENVVAELRMVDVADYVAYIKLERFANISDLVASAAELYFMPGTLRLGHGGEAEICWAAPPKIVLDLELRPRGATIYFTLALSDKHAEIDVNYVSFDEPGSDPLANTDFLEAAIADARIRKTHGHSGLEAGFLE